MSGMIDNMLYFACEDQEASPCRQEPTQPDVIETKCRRESPYLSGSASKYAEDIEALQQKYGSLENQAIVIALTDLLAVAPRERRRIEAYNGLKSTLAKRYHCKLTITSRKTKW